MQSISPRQDLLCELDLQPAPSEHHIMHKSMGGTDHDHNLVRLCSECHSFAHSEKFGGETLKITKNEYGLQVVRQSSGEVLFDRPKPPKDWNLSLWLSHFREWPQMLRIAAQTRFKYLPEDAMLEVAHILDEFDEENWAAKAKLLQVAMLRIPWGDRTEKFDALLRDLEIKKSQGYKLVAALDYWERDLSTRLETLPAPDVVLLIKAQNDPERAIALYEQRRAENGRYSKAQFQEDLGRGNTGIDPAPEYHLCPECGARHVRHLP